jgi:hypothetical protein
MGFMSKVRGRERQARRGGQGCGGTGGGAAGRAVCEGGRLRRGRGRAPCATSLRQGCAGAALCSQLAWPASMGDRPPRWTMWESSIALAQPAQAARLGCVLRQQRDAIGLLRRVRMIVRKERSRSLDGRSGCSRCPTSSAVHCTSARAAQLGDASCRTAGAPLTGRC